LLQEDYHYIYLAFGASFCIEEAYFHKTQDRETLSRAKVDLSTTDEYTTGLIKSFSVSTE
jgi:hypothetical protein